MKLALLQILMVTFSPLLIAEEVKLWQDGKISPEQPFKALVVGVIPGWGADTLILREIGGQERYCFAFLSGYSIIYTIYSKQEFDENKPGQGATFISPSEEVERFSWSMGMYKIGKIFEEEDIVAKYYAESDKNSNQPDPKLKLEGKEIPKPEQLKQELPISDFLTLKDPRPSAAFHRYTSLSFDNGVAPKNNAVLSRPILVINWDPPADPNNPQLSEPKFKNLQDVWQISGLTGYFTESEVEAILKQVYNLYSSDEKLIVPDLIVAGNNWGSGRQIEPVIGELSKKYKFRAYHIAGAFTKATLNAEPEERIKLLKEAQSKTQEGEVDTENPATTPKSAAEGK